MFIGHFGVGLGAKKAAPGISLGTLFLASQFLDLLWPTLLLFGWEHVKIQPGITDLVPLNFTDYPYSHSLLFAILWGIVIGGIYLLVKKNFRGAIILALCVLSHWVLDLPVHRPDLPLFPGSAKFVGFGLWNHAAVAILLEGAVFLTGLGLYLNATVARNNAGRYGFWGLILFLAAIHLLNLFGPPPASVKAIAWAGELQWLFVLWAYWVDRNREPRHAGLRAGVAAT